MMKAQNNTFAFNKLRAFRGVIVSRLSISSIYYLFFSCKKKTWIGLIIKRGRTSKDGISYRDRVTPPIKIGRVTYKTGSKNE